MTTSPSSSEEIKSAVLDTKFVWGKTIADAMEKAMSMEQHGWKIQGNPAPMFWNRVYGTGVAITRVFDVAD